mmetsp:Transcript_14977/g.32281  ORF Transcript_14977/g.32281 Transcript_14977/m.32281 type:complete len:232 (+) Transcript_14977:655-1350(+)
MSHLQRTGPDAQKARLLLHLISALIHILITIISHPRLHIPQKRRNKINTLVLEIRIVLVRQRIHLEQPLVRLHVAPLDLLLRGNDAAGLARSGRILHLFFAFALEKFARVEEILQFGSRRGGIHGIARLRGRGGDAIVLLEFLGREGCQVVFVVHHRFLGEELRGRGGGGSFLFLVGCRQCWCRWWRRRRCRGRWSRWSAICLFALATSPFAHFIVASGHFQYSHALKGRR